MVTPSWKKELEKLLSEKERVLLAIDGPCASGKTTLGTKIAEEFGGNLVHMDDFFLRPEQRTAERYGEAGGNVDRERFLEEVLLPLKKGEEFSYRPFDCKSLTLSAPVTVIPKKLTVVEGSYSTHPYFSDPYDLKIFLSVSPEIQKERLQKRSPHMLEAFLTRWIPLEEAYFTACSTREKANIIC